MALPLKYLPLRVLGKYSIIRINSLPAFESHKHVDIPQHCLHATAGSPAMFKLAGEEQLH